MSAPRMPWRDLMGFGLGVLKLSPQAFWALTPREINAALATHYGTAVAPPSRPELAALMTRFPDAPTTDDGGNHETRQ